MVHDGAWWCMVVHGGAWWCMVVVHGGVGAGVCLSDSTLEEGVSSPCHHCCFSAVVILLP